MLRKLLLKNGFQLTKNVLVPNGHLCDVYALNVPYLLHVTITFHTKEVCVEMEFNTLDVTQRFEYWCKEKVLLERLKKKK